MPLDNPPSPTDLTDAVTTYITIGNSDDGLSQREWSDFYAAVDQSVRDHATAVYGAFVAEPTSPFQNACWSAEIQPEDRDNLVRALAALAHAYGQDSIAWVEGVPHFIAPSYGAERP